MARVTSSAMVLFLALIACGAALAAASPAAGGRTPSIARRMLGQNDVSIGGGNRCRPGQLCNSRAHTAQTLSTLQAQSTIGLIAGSGGGFANTFAATQSVQRGAIAATHGDIPFAANQVAFDEALNPGSPFGLYSPFNRAGTSFGR